ncbi:reverse transcriptase domain-containing protein [Tanacetum coccineum]
MAEGEIDNLTMEKYLALTIGNQASSVVKPETEGNPLKDGWIDFRHEPSIPGISLKKPLSKGTVHRPKPLSNLKKSGTSSRKETRHYTKLGNGIMIYYINALLMTSIAIRSRNIENSSNSKGIDAIVNKLENLGRDMKKLKENVHAIQVGCQNRGGAHLDKDCPLNEEVKIIEEAKYGEFGRPAPFSYGTKYRVGPPRYYTYVNNHPPFGEKRPSLEELMNKHLEESTQKRAEMEEWVKKLQENAEINTRNQSASLKNLETQIEQLTKEFHTKAANEMNNSSIGQCKAMYANKETPRDNKPHEASFVFDKYTHVVQEKYVSSKILPCQLPPKELNPGNFTSPYTIGSVKFYVITDLGTSVDVIPKSLFEHLKLARLKKINMLVEMADMTKRSHIGIVGNVLVKIDKFLFPPDFVLLDMLNTRNETMILGRPFLATIHAEIDVFNREISLGVGGDRVTFDMDKKIHNFTTPVGKIFMINVSHNDESPYLNSTPSDEYSRFEKSEELHDE